MSEPLFIFQKQFLYSETANPTIALLRFKKGCKRIINKYWIASATLQCDDVYGRGENIFGEQRSDILIGKQIRVTCHPDFAHLFEEPMILLHA